MSMRFLKRDAGSLLLDTSLMESPFKILCRVVVRTTSLTRMSDLLTQFRSVSANRRV